MLGNRIAVAVGALGVAAAAAVKVAQRRRFSTAPAPAPAGSDARAEELRRKLAEARDLDGEREEFESAETPVDHVEAGGDVDARRRQIHDEGRAAAEEMRGGI